MNKIWKSESFAGSLPAAGTHLCFGWRWYIIIMLRIIRRFVLYGSINTNTVYFHTLQTVIFHNRHLPDVVYVSVTVPHVPCFTRRSVITCTWMWNSISAWIFGSPIKLFKKTSVIFVDVTLLLETGLQSRAGRMDSWNKLSRAWEWKQLPFFCEGDETRYSSVGITSDLWIIWRWVLEIPLQPDSLSETPTLSLSLHNTYSSLSPSFSSQSQGLGANEPHVLKTAGKTILLRFCLLLSPLHLFYYLFYLSLCRLHASKHVGFRLALSWTHKYQLNQLFCFQIGRHFNVLLHHW